MKSLIDLLLGGASLPNFVNLPTVERGWNAPYTGRSKTMKKNLRKIRQRQRRRAFLRSMKG